MNNYVWEVGALCSVLGYSDIRAARVIEVFKNSHNNVYKVIVQYDTATLLNSVNSGEPDALKFDAGGFHGHTSGKQRWKLEPNPKGEKKTFTLRRDGNWAELGKPMQSVQRGYRLSPVHQHYYDYNF